MKNLLSVLICLFVASIATTSAQFTNPKTWRVSQTNWTNSGTVPETHVGVTTPSAMLYVNADVYVQNVDADGSGTLEAHAGGEFYGNNSTYFKVQADAVRSTPGITRQSNEGSGKAINMDMYVWIRNTSSEGSAWAQLSVRW